MRLKPIYITQLKAGEAVFNDSNLVGIVLSNDKKQLVYATPKHLERIYDIKDTREIVYVYRKD